MTTYAILHKGDPERCIRFTRQYCQAWDEFNAGAIRNHFIHMSPSLKEKYPYYKIEDDFDSLRVSDSVAFNETFIDFENNPRRRAL